MSRREVDEQIQEGKTLLSGRKNPWNPWLKRIFLLEQVTHPGRKKTFFSIG
jgi:hypothetical protein